MILTVAVEDFRGQTATYSFGRVNHLLGCNESGKTSVREAIAFAFTGSDSSGNRAPVHLISWGSESTKVSIQTERATIQRTLTRKKNSSIRVVRGEVPNSLTQSQLEELLGCSADLFLTVFSPGYFWGLPLAKQQAVLSEVLPPFNATSYIETQLGGPLTDEEHVKFGFLKKRPDLVALTIANERREIQRQIDINEGRLRTLSALQTVPNEPPDCALAYAQLSQCEDLKLQWSRYNVSLSGYRQADAARASAQQVNAVREARRHEIREELSRLHLLEETKTFSPEKSKQLSELRSAFKSKPQYPQLVKEVGSDTCPTCGQVVGLKHRERCKEENNKRLVEYEKELQAIEVHNAGIQKSIDALLAEEEAFRRELRGTQEHNDAVRRSKAKLEGELAGLSDLPLPSVPAVPEPPTLPVDAAREQELRHTVDHHKRLVAEYEYARRRLAENGAELARVRSESDPLLAARDRLSILEEVVKSLPEARLKHQSSLLMMHGYELEIDESSINYKRSDGCPHELLSTGHAMRADVSFSMKLNSLMHRPVNVVFVDNADLIDEKLGISPPVQVFCAYVKPGQKSVLVETFQDKQKEEIGV